MVNPVSGFSKLSKSEKIDWVISNYFSGDDQARDRIMQYWNSDTELQRLHDEFIENTITNYYLPFGIAPNFLINDKLYAVPLAIEESSVVAAASKSAKFWLDRGGFRTRVLGTKKVGQVHFIFKGEHDKLKEFFRSTKDKLFIAVNSITRNMQKRGGGILDISLVDKTADLEGYYQLHARFETLDAMGANFINSCLEQFAKTLKDEALVYPAFSKDEKEIQVIMSILSNYVPECLVQAEVQCPIDDLTVIKGIRTDEFAAKFVQAIRIAEIEPYRAVTHNKGIMNGVDAVVVATGNDFRAIESCVHAYASRNGQYTSLSGAELDDGIFRFWLEIPLALGTVGGLTRLHPLVGFAHELLGNPSAPELMQIVAAVGLAQNFAALTSLVTTGIQQGHMKMHLMNILNEFKATDTEKSQLVEHFKTHTVTHSAVVKALERLRL
ncbi:MAG: hydroxymethylglutaryl-CoA reductase, degradative [Flavobacteriaceae bacterium]|nr:hydroxymethylglutaryl-CoA reductase, degradative [Flavobacteriaceae bacterium]